MKKRIDWKRVRGIGIQTAIIAFIVSTFSGIDNLWLRWGISFASSFIGVILISLPIRYLRVYFYHNGEDKK